MDTHTNTLVLTCLSPSVSLSVSLSLCSEKPVSLQVLLTDRHGEHSAATRDQQAPPLSPCLVKPLPPKTNSVSDPTSSTRTLTGPPRDDSSTGSPSFHTAKPLSNTGSLPGVCMEAWDQNPLGDLAPPPPPEEADCAPQWTRMSPVSLPAQAPPLSSSYALTPSPADRCHLMMHEEPHYTRHSQSTSPGSSPTPRMTPPPPTYPTRTWSCLNVDPPDDVNSPDPPVYSPPHSPCNAPLPPVGRPSWASSPPPSQDHRAALPVERWAENVNRYYGSQSAMGEGGGAAVPGEELSELDSLYQASLLAPSMHRGSRGVSPQPTSNKPGRSP